MIERSCGNPAQELTQRYTDQPYPPYDPASEALRLNITRLDALDKVSDACFAGHLAIESGMRVLVAGGGTGDATLFLAEQLMDTPSEVVYVDPSPSSMRLAQEGAAIRGLSNIRWIQGSLLDLPKSSEFRNSFDYINCCGVLHHLSDPGEGLQALEAVLAPEGAMVLMLYALYGRQEVYRLQTMLRNLNSDIDDPGRQIANARVALNAMPQEWFDDPRNQFIIEEIKTDAGLYDMLLHTSDQPYTIEGIDQLLQGAGLKKIAFADAITGGTLGYRPESYLPAALWDKFAGIPLLEREAIAEKASGEMTRHAFYAARENNRSASLEDPEMVLAYSMQLGPDEQLAIQQLAKDRGTESIPITPLARHGRYVEVTFGPYGAELLHQIDGRRTVPEIVEHVSEKTDITSGVAFNALQRMYEPLHAADWLMLRHVSMPPYPKAHDMQHAWLARNNLTRPIAIEGYTLHALQRVIAHEETLPTLHF